MWGAGCMVHNVGCGVYGAQCGVRGVWCTMWGAGCMVHNVLFLWGLRAIGPTAQTSASGVAITFAAESSNNLHIR